MVKTAKCGCNPNCTCLITGSNCLNVRGVGTPTNPYQFNVAVDGTSLVCTANGLQRKINQIDTNTIDINGDGSVASPLTMDVILTPKANIPDPDALGFPNLIKELPGPGGGIYVSCEDIQDCVGAAVSNLLAGNDCLIYSDATNAITLQICSAPNGLQCLPAGSVGCAAGGLAVIPSSDPNNSLTFGTDGRLLTPPFKVAAGPCLQPITQAGTPADPYIIAPQVAPELNGLECIVGQGLAVIPSSDPNNALVFGADTRLYANICFKAQPSQVVNGAPCLQTTGDGCTTPYTIITGLSTDPCQGICCRADGLFVFQNPTPNPGLAGLFSENWSTGVFNGTFNNTVVMAPRCLNFTNPSNCRTLLGNIIFGGTVDLGKTSGNFVLQFETSLTGTGGPWSTAVSAAALDPDPPTPQRTRQVYNLNGAQEQAFVIAPGATQQVCYRIVLSGFFLVNGQIFNSDRSAAISSLWGQNVNTCP